MKFISPFFARGGGILMIALLLGSCNTSTDPAADGSLSLSSAYTPLPNAPATALPKSEAALAEITVSRARFVIRDIKFKSVTEDSLSFKTEPVVVELDLSGETHTISSVTTKAGDYRRVEFDVHRVEPADISSLPAVDQPAFDDFLAGEKYSIIIEGTFTPTGGVPASFTYRSKVDAKQKIDLDPPLVIADGSTSVNTTILISSDGWFRNSQGVFVDPADTNNEGIIDENLKASIRVFKDDNRDGSKD